MPRLWVNIVDAAGKIKVTSIKCNRGDTTVDDLKKLVKTEFSPKFDHIAAPDLIVKGNDSEVIDEDIYLSARGDEGTSKETAFKVLVPAAAGGPDIFSYNNYYFHFIFCDVSHIIFVIVKTR